jgi:hypothetical protein
VGYMRLFALTGAAVGSASPDPAIMQTAGVKRQGSRTVRSKPLRPRPAQSWSRNLR